jgi:hypothetical protein
MCLLPLTRMPMHTHTELFCPTNNTDFNALWPAGVPALATVTGAFCFGGWAGTVSRTCLATGQWASTITGSCTRTPHTHTHIEHVWRAHD